MKVSPRPKWRALVSGVGLVVVVAAWPLSRPVVRLPTPKPIDNVVEIDGLLRTSADEHRVDAEVCRAAGHEPLARLPITLHVGDAVALADVCRVGEVSRMNPEDIAALRLPIEVNTASVPELATLPGIGPTIAQRIVDARPYYRLYDLLRVRGIGPVRLRRLASRVRFEAADR